MCLTSTTGSRPARCPFAASRPALPTRSVRPRRRAAGPRVTRSCRVRVIARIFLCRLRARTCCSSPRSPSRPGPGRHSSHSGRLSAREGGLSGDESSPGAWREIAGSILRPRGRKSLGSMPPRLQAICIQVCETSFILQTGQDYRHWAASRSRIGTDGSDINNFNFQVDRWVQHFSCTTQ